MNHTCLIRCEYSQFIGFGHLIRCLAIARELHNRGYRVYMLSSSGEPIPSCDTDVIERWLSTDKILGSLEDVSELVLIAKDLGASLAILDFYNISESYQLVLRDAGIRWLQFDNKANQPFWSDWVISINPAASISKYLPLRKKSNTQFLLGLQYAVLRSNFEIYNHRKKCIGKVKKIMISFGGGDDYGMTLFCLNALNNIDWRGEIVVIVGQKNPYIEKIIAWIDDREKKSSYDLKINEQDIAKVMFESDLGIISGGMITFETAIIGVPTLMLKLADNQRDNVDAWCRLGFGVDLGESQNLSETSFSKTFLNFVDDLNLRKSMSQRGKELVDGRGVKRVVDELLDEKSINV